MLKIAYLGPEGSYSGLAVEKFRADAQGVPYPSFYLAMQALKSGECDLAVLPIENSLNGAVLVNIDLLQREDGVFADEETSLKLDHRLAVKEGADFSGISRIYSHEQTLAQCFDYLSKNFPNAKQIPAPSTSASLDMLKTNADASIVGAHVKRAGICLSPRNIADFPQNFTSFLLVRRGGVDPEKATLRVFFSVTCRHKSGALLDILEPMREGGLNMTKIQSRPLKNSSGEYRFFIEAEGDYSSPKVRGVLAEVEKISLSFKLLGAY